jgi:KUP system potassium uptake protein
MVMATWHRGIFAMRDVQEEHQESPEHFLAALESGRIARVPGTAVFLSRTGFPITPLLVRHIEQFKALQETCVSLTVQFDKIPRVPISQRAETRQLEGGLWSVELRFGFLDVPNLAAALSHANEQGCPLDLNEAVYFVARDDVVADRKRRRMTAWRRMLFAVMYRNAVHAADRFDLPPDKLLEIGRQVAL